MLTAALTTALSWEKWEAAKILLEAGADSNGQPYSAEQQAIGPWMESPLAAIFGHGNRFFGDADNHAVELEMAELLFRHGATFRNPKAQWALIGATASGNLEGALFLLKAGASPNGMLTPSELEELAHGNIRSAGHGWDYARTAFYEALEGALRVHNQDTSAARSWAGDQKRKARILAVHFLEAGGRFIVGKIYDNEIQRDPDVDVISILLAAAHREGRLQELAARLVEGLELERKTDTPERAAARRDASAYVRSVLVCPSIRPRSAVDHMELCG